MGRQESLTAMALGRGCYEDEVIETGELSSLSAQRFDDKGHPRNSETRRRERDHVRAANEVMQVTGVVEDSLAAKYKAQLSEQEENREARAALRLMEVGRMVLVGGVWGVLGLRMRVLLYRPYCETGIMNILRREQFVYRIPQILIAGFPMVVAHHIIEWVSLFVKLVIKRHFKKNDALTKRKSQIIDTVCNVFFCYAALHIRLFATLQNLHLIPSSRRFPGLLSFVPFSSSSPLRMPPPPSLTRGSLLSWGTAFFRAISPLLVMIAHGQAKYAISNAISTPILRYLPQPIGDSPFSGLPILTGTESDALSLADERDPQRSDEPTLRALEGLPALETANGDSSDEEEISHATLISFDVEPSEPVERSPGSWSAELRSTNELRPPERGAYRVTGLTLLPPVFATECLREIGAGIMLLPLEAIMVRTIGRAFRHGTGLGTADLWNVGPAIHGVGNLLASLTMQLAVTGLLWMGFTVRTQKRAEKLRRAKREDQEGVE
ncbi:hypothetical protein B2J93_4404 [Marssonina coronariae]|uniref:Uncharacterized protein n=1 Tax=Diplocarpon coronariae TaxID=2795749 RepID=A0A218Z3A0_9HELO|nr:hypothetical protein B2J93_4404 [Marssonina coronariae]